MREYHPHSIMDRREPIGSIDAIRCGLEESCWRMSSGVLVDLVGRIRSLPS